MTKALVDKQCIPSLLYRVEAIEYYGRPIKIDPNYADVWYNTGVDLDKLRIRKYFDKAKQLGYELFLPSVEFRPTTYSLSS